MKKFLLILLMTISSFVYAQQVKTPVQFGDDTWVNVPLQFPFPFYGKVFTNSFMFSNGVVALMNVGSQPTDSYCCSGIQVNSQMPVSFHYTIMPMQTDLFPVSQSRFYTQGDTTFQKYWWENIAEYSNTSNLNTFSVELKPSGYIGIKYDQVNIQNQVVTSAIIGDASKGEYTLHYHGQGMTASNVPGLIEHNSTGSICASNPLASPSCPGYAEAYFNQQCSANPLYAVNCPGYAQAYLNQQCSANPLYNQQCPGYAEAYFAQQCELNGLYDTKCPNYSTEYAKKQLLNQTTTTVTTISTANDPVATVQVVSDTNINNAITTPSTTSPTSVSPASPTSVLNAQPTTQTVTQQAVTQSTPTQSQVAAQQEQKQEQNKTEQKVAGTVEKKMDSGAKGDRQKMRDAVAKVQKEIAKEAQEAKSIEAQVATQGLVVGSMNYVPGFDAYKNAMIPDTNAILMARQYQKPVVDNQRAQRRLSGANESKWQEMVDSQYQIGR